MKLFNKHYATILGCNEAQNNLEEFVDENRHTTPFHSAHQLAQFHNMVYMPTSHARSVCPISRGREHRTCRLTDSGRCVQVLGECTCIRAPSFFRTTHSTPLLPQAISKREGTTTHGKVSPCSQHQRALLRRQSSSGISRK